MAPESRAWGGDGVELSLSTSDLVGVSPKRVSFASPGNLSFCSHPEGSFEESIMSPVSGLKPFLSVKVSMINHDLRKVSSKYLSVDPSFFFLTPHLVYSWLG